MDNKETANQQNQEQSNVSNRFKRAAEKKKVSPGGRPEELVAGAPASGEQPQEVVPEVKEEPAQEAAPVHEEPVQALVIEQPEEQPAQQPKSVSLVATYEAKQKAEPEARNVRLQAVITPTLSRKLDALLDTRKIKSKNDLINFLLERYFEETQED